MATLYELTNEFLELQKFIEMNEEEDLDPDLINDTLESLNMEIEHKIENTIKFIKNIEPDINGYKEEEKRLYNKRKRAENLIEKLKENIDFNMRRANIAKLKAGTFNVGFRKSKSVEITDESLIPDEFKVEQPPKISKTDIGKYLKEGNKLEGAVLVENENLSIR